MIKQERKSTRGTHLSDNIKAARKRDKQYVVHRIVVTSLERKTRCDV